MTPISNFQTLNVYYLGGKDEVAQEEVKTADDPFDSIMDEIEFEIPPDADLDTDTFSDVELEYL